MDGWVHERSLHAWGGTDEKGKGDATVLLHGLQEADNDLGAGAEQHLPLATLLGVADGLQGIVKDGNANHGGGGGGGGGGDSLQERRPRVGETVLVRQGGERGQATRSRESEGHKERRCSARRGRSGEREREGGRGGGAQHLSRVAAATTHSIPHGEGATGRHPPRGKLSAPAVNCDELDTRPPRPCARSLAGLHCAREGASFWLGCTIERARGFLGGGVRGGRFLWRKSFEKERYVCCKAHACITLMTAESKNGTRDS